MRIFVRGTGRAGSSSFTRASQHAENYKAAHESRSHLHSKERLDYPDEHIDVDNRLTWFLGLLHERWRPKRFLCAPPARRRGDRSTFVRRWDLGGGLGGWSAPYNQSPD